MGRDIDCRLHKKYNGGMSRLVIIAVIVAVVLFLFRWFLAPAPKKPSSPGSTEMVKDPNCEIYVPQTEALRREISGKEHFFCSEKCADEYEAKSRPA